MQTYEVMFKDPSIFKILTGFFFSLSDTVSC